MAAAGVGSFAGDAIGTQRRRWRLSHAAHPTPDGTRLRNRRRRRFRSLSPSDEGERPAAGEPTSCARGRRDAAGCRGGALRAKVRASPLFVTRATRRSSLIVVVERLVESTTDVATVRTDERACASIGKKRALTSSDDRQKSWRRSSLSFRNLRECRVAVNDDDDEDEPCRRDESNNARRLP